MKPVPWFSPLAAAYGGPGICFACAGSWWAVAWFAAALGILGIEGRLRRGGRR